MSNQIDVSATDPDLEPLVDHNLVIALRLAAHLYEQGLLDPMHFAATDTLDEIQEIVGFIYDTLNTVGGAE